MDLANRKIRNPIVLNWIKHRGDMYHVRALLSLFGNAEAILGRNKNDNDSDIEEMRKYLTSGWLDSRVKIKSKCSLQGINKKYYGAKQAKKILQWGKGQLFLHSCFGVTSATRFIAQKLEFHKGDSAIRMLLSEGMVGEKLDESKYQELLELKGRFPTKDSDKKFILINYRGSGNLHGGVHPALDTGRKGMLQLIEAVEKNFENVEVIPVGDYPENWEGANLFEYWKWFSESKNRSIEAGLLRHLKKNYNVLGVIGMRSGVLDLFAFLGFKTISIDRVDEDGINRVIALQNGIGDDSFKVVILTHKREGEMRSRINNKQNLGKGILEWPGEIHSNDLNSIIKAAKKIF